jgi:hypothetical protein
MTPAEAERAYADVPGRRGPPRRKGYQTFADALRTRIAEGDDESRLQAIVKRMTEVNEDKDLSPQAKRKQLDALRREMDRETDPETVDKLRGYLERLEDPVGHAAREAEGEGGPLRLAMRVGRAIADGINPLSSRFVRLSRDPRMHASLVRAMQASEEHGVPFTLRDALGLIRRDSLLRTEMQPFHELATRLLRLAPDVPVYSAEQAHARGLIDDATLADFQAGGLYGHADVAHPTEPHIVVNINQPHLHGTHVETVLHEAMHTVTAKYIAHLQETNPNHPDLLALRAIGDELGRAASENRGTLSETDRDLVNAARSFATMQPHETHTMLMTNPTIQALAASRIASPEFRARMAELGFPAREQGRSVWRYFTDVVRRALGMRAPASASEYTMLDHAMRVTEDITDRAAAYNERYLPKDPVLHSAAEPLFRSAALSFSPRVRDIMDRIDPRGLGERARGALLQAMPGDHLVARYTNVLKNLPVWRAASDAIARSSKRFVDNNYDKVRQLTQTYNRLPDKQDLGRLMTDATLADARLTPGADNSHLTTPEQQRALSDLQARYAKLSPAARTLYGQFRDTYQAWYTQDRSAQLERWMRQFMPDASDAQKNDLRDAAAKGNRGLTDFANNQANGASARDVAKLHLLGQVQGDYFPLRRSGRYVVQYGDRDDPGSYGVEFFDRRSEADARRRNLLANDVADVKQVGLKRQYETSELAPHHPFIDEMLTRLGEQGYDQHERQEIRDQINSVLLMHATASQRGRAAQGMRRRGVQGAMTDHAQVLANEFLSMQGRIGNLEHGDERSAALKDLREEVRQLERSDTATPDRAVTAAQVVREVDKRSATIDDLNNPLQSMMAKANQWSFAQSLMSASHMLTSSLEAHSNAMSLLGARYGYARATIAIGAGLRHASPALKQGAINTINAVRGELTQNDWNILNVLRDRLVANGAHKQGVERMLDGLENAGLVDHTQLQDMRMQAHPGLTGGRVGTAWNWFTNLNAAGAHSVDAMNKVAIAHAAFNLEYKASGDWRKAADTAVEIARQVMPNYQLKARIASQRGFLGPFGAPLMQFKNYGLHELSLLANLTRDAMSRSKTPEERWTAAKGLAGILATRAMLAGVLTFTGDATRYIGGAYDLFTGADKPHNYQNNIRRFITEALGPELGEVVARGVPHALGIDLHRRVGLENLLEIPEMTSFGKEGAGQVLLGLATGATGENLETSWGGFTKLMHGDLSGLQDLIPRPIRDAMKAYNLAETGITDRQGKVILPPAQIGAGGVAAQALGFQPAAVSEFREGRNAVLEAREEAQSAAKQLSQRWLQADPTDRPAIMSEIRQYNADPAHQGMTITVEQLMKDLQSRRKQATMPFGLKLPAKAARSLAAAGSFANVPQGAQVGAP